MKTPALLLSLAAPLAALELIEDEDKIHVRRGETPVLSYWKSEIAAPEGADPKFRRSGFIHPLATPRGAVLTGIQPADHYHHLGLWHAWVKTRHGEDEPDFWNLARGSGRVRFAKVASLDRDPDGGVGFEVVQEHLAYKGAEGAETVVLRETLSVRVLPHETLNLVDYRVRQTNVSDLALELPQHRYGGCLAFRGRHDWDADNSALLTSEGKTRADSHTTRARWIAASGPADDGHAGLAILVDPANRDFPQRLRTWPADLENGAVFINFVPTQEKGWSLEPGDTIEMRYRLVTCDAKPGAGEVEAWFKEAFR